MTAESKEFEVGNWGEAVALEWLTAKNPPLNPPDSQAATDVQPGILVAGCTRTKPPDCGATTDFMGFSDMVQPG